MRVNNPMFNVETAKRMSATVNSKIESGERVYKRGPEHHLWKGNRDFNNVCRCQLYQVWTKVILKRDNFKCTCCLKGSGGLQVHHTRPLRDIIGVVKDRHNVKSFY